MWILDLFLTVTLGVWVMRAIRMMGSIKAYSCIPHVGASQSQQHPKVSFIVPCRNEEHNIDILLPSLMKQDYPNLEFVFLNDRSTDRTGELLKKYADQDSRIQIINGRPLPEGWTGKNNAMAQCQTAATGDWLLYSDADTLHDPHSASSAVAYAQKRNLDLLTLSARCVCKTFGEYLVQPMGIGCFSVWFKLADVNNPQSQTPLACGQYLMIRKQVLDAVGGPECVKSAVCEDLALFQTVKDLGYRCELAIGSHLFATRMYRSFKESWVGWRRIYLHALGKNVPSILRKIGMLLCFSFAPFLVMALLALAILMGQDVPTLTLSLSLGLCLFILFLRSRSHAALKARQWSIFLHPLSALAITAILIDCLSYHFRGKKTPWKQQAY